MINSELKGRILSSDRVIITCHTSPDGDAIGSSLALHGLLNKMNVDSKVVLKERVSPELSFLPLFESIIIDSEFEIKEDDLVVVLDCGNTDRINLNVDVNESCVINIDHHKSNDQYGVINWVDTDRAAVGEMIFQMAEEFDIEVDESIAQCIYTSILTDTGGFKYSNTSERTHEIAGKLIAKGIDFTKIHENVFDRQSYKQVLMQAMVIDSMEMHFDGKLCIMELKKEELEKIEALEEDTGHLVNIGMKIDTVEMALLLKEKDEKIKGSLRSKKYVDVCEIAKIFGGGGHVRASGFGSEESTVDIKKKIIKHVEGII